MQVSLIAQNLLPGDAVGDNLVRKARFFLGRGDDVRLLVAEPPPRPPADLVPHLLTVALGDLLTPSGDRLAGVSAHVRRSELVVYDYPVWYSLAESIRSLPAGAVLFDYHGVTPPELWGSDAERDRFERSQAGTVLAHFAHLAIAHSRFAADELTRLSGLPGERIRVLPLAVPLDCFTPGPPDPALTARYGLAGQRVLLYVGRVAGNKRLDVLIRALARLRADLPEVRLLIVGDARRMPAYAELAAGLRALAGELGIGERVIFTGWVPDVAPYFRLADAFVTASQHEGFGLPALEAMASGVPAVVSASGALPETVGDAGLTFTPGDPDDLAARLRQVLTDNSLRNGLIERGLVRARLFSPGRYQAGLAQIVAEAVSRAHAGPRPAPQAPAAGDLESAADVALRSYVVRSNLPMVGRLVAWVRRNLTSHVKEAYLDRIVERQVLFNVRIARELSQLRAELAAARAEIAALREELNRKT
jgi:glycosyltransferase involved in cell wall biosynthesis